MRADAPVLTNKFNAKKKAILDAATHVFNTKGIRGGTLSDVAQCVGLATNSVTYYYRKRDVLAAACLLRTIETFEAIIAKAADGATVSRRIEILYSEYLATLAAVRRGEQPELMSFGNLRALPSPQIEQVYAAHKAMARNARNLLKSPETAALSSADLSARNYLIVSLLSWVRLWLPAHEVDEFPVLARRIADFVVRGVAVPNASTPVFGSEAEFWQTLCERPEISDPFLRAGSLLVNQHGYRGASIERIASHLDLTKGAFYGRRDSKDDLIKACFERKFLVIKLVWESATAMPGTGWSRLCTVLHRLAWFQLSESGPLVRTGAIMAVPDVGFRAFVREETRRYERRIANLIVDGMADGSIRPCDPTLAAHMLSCVIDHSATLKGWSASACAQNVGELFLKPALFGVLAATP